MSKHAWVSEGPLDYVTKSELGCAGVRACVCACVREWLTENWVRGRMNE